MYIMYSEWVSLSEDIKHDTSNRSALSNYPSSVGRDVARTVVRSLVENSAENAANDRFSTPKDVEWVMQVICFGLGLPLSEGETLKGCVAVYLDWLSALSSQPKQEVPKEILRQPNVYSQRILQHLRNLFVPKTEGTLALQASLCMKVLQGVQRISHECSKMNEATLKVLLRFLLSVADSLLSPPFVPGGLTEQLCRLLIEVLFDVWLQACIWAFPGPPLWKTLQEMCYGWRHHPDVVALWNKSVFSITRRVLLVEYGSSFPLYPLDDKKHEIRIPTTLDNKCLVQCWFRFLHVLGNPVDLSCRETISNTRKFKEHALLSTTVHQPSSHPCLSILPQNFYAAMKGVATLVNTFLGIKCNCESPVMFSLISPVNAGYFPSKAEDKKRGGLAMATSTDHLSQFSRDAQRKISGRLEPGPPQIFDNALGGNLSASMPTENSILHLLGPWLFQAALVHVNVESAKRKINQSQQSSFSRDDVEKSYDDGETQSVGEPMSSEFEQGRAEAFGALCRIFCSQRSGKILPVYLSRFYFSLCAGLVYDKSCTGHVLSSILLNSTNLLRVNLPGVHVVTPHLISALETVLGQTDLKMRCDVPMVQLQRAGVHLLLSMLCLPNHFKELPIADISGSSSVGEQSNLSSGNETFISLKLKLIKLLMCALENETDSHNTQMLLGGVMLFVQDSALVEESSDIVPHSPALSTIQHSLSLEQERNEDLGGAELTSTEDPERLSLSHSEMTNGPVFRALSDIKLQLGGTSSRHLFVHLTNLVSQKLIFGSKWKTDFHVTLSAFELMSGMAEMNISDINKEECKRTIQWLCDYVEYQAKQPAPFHSRDLHSMMVAAFTCLLTWITSHPWLLDDQKSLQAILEVVELGISGSKSKVGESQDQQGEVKTQPKGDKQLKPASFRVREAAEAALSCIMEHVGVFPSPCGPASSSSLLDEDILMDYLPGDDHAKRNRFQYFVIDDSVIVGILQGSVQQHDGRSPTATLLLRGPTGRTAWTVELRQIPDCKKELLGISQSEPPKRPRPNYDIPVLPQCIHQHFPSDVEGVPLTKANLSIPPTNAIPCDKLTLGQKDVQSLIDKQGEEEISARKTIGKENENLVFPCPVTEKTPPKSVSEFSACRMILARLGLLRPEEYEKVRPMGTFDRAVTSLSPLNPAADGFYESLRELDHLPTRCFDTVYVFYVKREQHEARQILTNEVKDCDNKDMFYEFLQSLGWPVEVKTHPGWTGNSSSSWKLSQLKQASSSTSTASSSRSTITSKDSGNADCTKVTLMTLDEERSAFVGIDDADQQANADEDSKDHCAEENKRILYYGDTCCEIAFVVPSLFPRVTVKRKTSRTLESKRKDFATKRPTSITNLPSTQSSSSVLDILPETRGLSLSRNPADTTIDLRHLSKLNTHSPSSETIIMVVWLEHFADHETFPDNDLLSELGISKDPAFIASPSGRPQEKETAVIFITPLHNGLFRIRTKSTIKSPMAGPLVDGMVVSRRSLGSMVRHTAVNIGRRRRLDIDNYSPPHVCRKLKIQDIIRKCRRSMTFPEFYSSLFEEQS